MTELFGMPIDWVAIWTTVKISFLTTAILMLLCIPIAWKIARSQSVWRVPIEAVVALPLVLPPTVIGFYLLIVMNPHGYLADFLRLFGHDGRLTFTFTGLIIGSVFYSLPFMMQPLIHAFEQVPQSLIDAARTLRANRLDWFWQIVMPLSRRGLLTAVTLTFAHTVGEFGVVLMVGGNIPGETRVISTAIFDHVEALEYPEAHGLSLLMIGFAMTVLTTVYALNRKFQIRTH